MSREFKNIAIKTIDIANKLSEGNPEDAFTLYQQLSDKELVVFEAIVRSILLFSDASVSTVREPWKYNPKEVEDFFMDGISNGPLQAFLEKIGIAKEWLPSPKEYDSANRILKFLATQRKLGAPEILYRGIENLSANDFLDLTKPFASYSIGQIASTSYDKKEALGFAGPRPYRILYIISNPKKRGLNIDTLSAWDHEKEVILGGKIELDKIEWSRMTERGFEATNDWVELVRRVTDAENGGGRERVPLVTVYATML